MQKVTKVVKAKGHTNGRTFTSKYRGVHQTFPTKRWEAQFRCAEPLRVLCTCNSSISFKNFRTCSRVLHNVHVLCKKGHISVDALGGSMMALLLYCR